MAATGDLILEVNNIEVVYNKAIQALRGLSLAVPKGKIVALLGSNGAGKSTVLKAVSALLPMENGLVTEGRITFDGQAVEQNAPHTLVRRGLFHVMEGRRIFADLTVEENLTAATYALTGRDIAPDFDIVYRYFPRLAERRKSIAGYLSGGEQQMLAIGRALVAKPRVILWTSPRSALPRCWSRRSSRSSPASMRRRASPCCWSSRTPPSPSPSPITATSWRPAASSSTGRPRS